MYKQYYVFMNWKKFFTLLLCLLLIVILFKIFVGHFFIVTSLPYNNPIYKLTINSEVKGLGMEIKKYNEILPNTLSFVTNAIVFTPPQRFEINYGERILMNIKGYYCFSNINGKNLQVGCANYEHEIMKEINNINYTHLVIKGGSLIGLTNDIVYDGAYKADITDLLNHKGIYTISIEVEHDNIKAGLEYILDLV